VLKVYARGGGTEEHNIDSMVPLYPTLLVLCVCNVHHRVSLPTLYTLYLSDAMYAPRVQVQPHHGLHLILSFSLAIAVRGRNLLYNTPFPPHNSALSTSCFTSSTNPPLISFKNPPNPLLPFNLSTTPPTHSSFNFGLHITTRYSLPSRLTTKLNSLSQSLSSTCVNTILRWSGTPAPSMRRPRLLSQKLSSGVFCVERVVRLLRCLTLWARREVRLDVRLARCAVRECWVARRVLWVRVMVVMVDWASATSVDSRWDSGGVILVFNSVCIWDGEGGAVTYVLLPPSPFPYNTLPAHASPSRSPYPPPRFLRIRFFLLVDACGLFQ